MEEKIFLEQNRSINSNNTDSNVDIGLSAKMRHSQNDNVSKTLSLFEQYNKERDECDKYRLILTVNPICSNVLYNVKSEIVVNEGSSACTMIYDGDGGSLPKNTYARNAINTTTPITYRQAICDTEYSHKDNGNFVYHCGVDIFNNHMLRAQEFNHVNKMSSEAEATSSKVFNTIRDYLRDGKGDIVKEDIHTEWHKAGLVPMHLYHYDNILSMEDAFYERCKELDGWWGFINPGNIEIPNSSNSAITFNRMMANNKSCEFIDLYPDRSLFSFIPKYNKHRKRVEKNWDYCITYPYKKDKELIDTICGGEGQAIRANIKIVRTSSLSPRLQCSSYFKHNLKVGDYVSIYYYYPTYDGETVEEITFQKFNKKVKVVSIGDANGKNKDKIFSVSYDDIEAIYDYLNDCGCFFKKINHDMECSYYFRIFKKLNANDAEIEDIRSDVNKSAFARNIYGDETAQIIFLDDVDITDLTDANGAPVTEVYLTILKRNAGRDLWYRTRDYSNEKVEESHCFGKITSGLDFSGIDNEPMDYNIHYLHNLDKESPEYINYISVRNTFSAWGETINNYPMPKTIEDDLTIEDDEFYGDVVEFDVYEYKETTISEVYHRFNTMQREIFDRGFMNIYNDEIVSDDYDYANGRGLPFSALTYYVNDVVSVTEDVDKFVDGSHLCYGNISPEGYYYKPHYKIQVRSLNEDVSRSEIKEVNYSECMFGSFEDNYILKAKVPVDYGYFIGDFIAFYDKVSGEISWGEIMQFSSMTLTIRFSKNAFDNLDSQVRQEYFMPNNAERRLYGYWSKDSVPFNAKYCPTNRRFTWRSVVLPSEMTNTDKLFNLPFSNGRFYIEDKINLFLRRQDPEGKYGLSVPLYKTTKMTVLNPMTKFTINGYKPIDLSQIEYMLENTDTCY